MEFQETMTWAVHLFFVFVFSAAFVVNMGLCLWLNRKYKRKQIELKDVLKGFLGPLAYRSEERERDSLSERVDSFIQDVQEIIDNPHRNADRRDLLYRINTKDERKDYMHTLDFERRLRVTETLVDLYPYLGILGTITSISAGLFASGLDGSAGVTQSQALISSFAAALWTTFVGLVLYMVFSFWIARRESEFSRLTDQRDTVRRLISKAKTQLSAPSRDRERGYVEETAKNPSTDALT